MESQGLVTMPGNTFTAPTGRVYGGLISGTSACHAPTQE